VADINLRVWLILRANCERNRLLPKQCCGNSFEIDGCLVSNSGDNISSETTSQTSIVTKLVSSSSAMAQFIIEMNSGITTRTVTLT